MLEFNVLRCKRFIAPCPILTPERIVRNYEFDFYLTSARTVYVDSKEIQITDGCVFLKQPGQTVCGVGDFNCYSLTIDFSKTAPLENYTRSSAYVLEPVRENVLVSFLPTVLFPSNPKEFQTVLEAISTQHQMNSEETHLLVSKLLFMMNTEACNYQLRTHKTHITATDKVIQYINTNFRENITLDELSDIVHLDKCYLIRIFKRQTGLSPMEYLQNHRLEYAEHLLLNINMSISEIAFSCGYNSPSFFSMQFKRKFLVPPKTYRNLMSPAYGVNNALL